MAGGSANAHEEPNLVPLLDLVLQLVMFFMMCANFVMEQVDKTILLPVAQSAKPMPREAAMGDVVFLNINSAGELLVVGRPKPLTTDAEVTVFLQEVAAESKRRAGEELRKAGGDPAQAQPAAMVIVRAHKDADYASVYRVLRRCQDAGLRRLQLRANIAVKG
jgi:biopolymer transport protein ExbD